MIAVMVILAIVVVIYALIDDIIFHKKRDKKYEKYEGPTKSSSGSIRKRKV